MSILLTDIPLWDYDDPDELLGVDEVNHPEGQPDFSQHGWGIIKNNSLSLVDEDDNAKITFSPQKDKKDRCLVLILHSTDDPPPQEDDIELGFWLDAKDIPHFDEEVEIHVSMNKFIKERIEEIVQECRDENIKELILCTCNPHEALVKRPAGIPDDINVYFPKGVVEHWKMKKERSGIFGLLRKEEISYELRAKDWHKL